MGGTTQFRILPVELEATKPSRTEKAWGTPVLLRNSHFVSCRYELFPKINHAEGPYLSPPFLTLADWVQFLLFLAVHVSHKSGFFSMQGLLARPREYNYTRVGGFLLSNQRQSDASGLISSPLFLPSFGGNIPGVFFGHGTSRRSVPP